MSANSPEFEDASKIIKEYRYRAVKVLLLTLILRGLGSLILGTIFGVSAGFGYFVAIMLMSP